MRRSLTLRKDTLAELTPGDLAAVGGASVHVTIDTFLTQICVPLVLAVYGTVHDGVTRLSVVECP
ncbi:MAG TPA: hypothetical protein VF519_15380 [Mycobacteriales bacterium]|jgi:hypothetical protein